MILVLWLLAFLSVIALALLRETREDTRFARAIIEDAKAEALAEGGVAAAVAGLVGADRRGTAWSADGVAHEIRLGDGTVTVRVEDDSGKIDINQADEPLLEAVFRSAGVAGDEARRLAAATADYRDADDLRRPGGAEAADYAAAGRRHGPTNRPFETIDELLQVLGMTRAIFAAVEPLATVHSPTQSVNLTAAPTSVLNTLPGMDPRRLRALLAGRGAGGAGPRPFVVTVTAVARTSGGGTFVREATLRWIATPGRPFDVLSWRRRGLGSGDANGE